MHRVLPKITSIILSFTLACALVPVIPGLALAQPDGEASSPGQTVEAPVAATQEQGGVEEPEPSAEPKPSEESGLADTTETAEKAAPVAEDPSAKPASEEPAKQEREVAPVEQRSVGFVYFDEAEPSVGGQQLVAIALDDESASLASAELMFTTPSGESATVPASELAGNAALFSLDLQEAGEYTLERMKAVEADEGISIEADLSVGDDEIRSFTVTEAAVAMLSLDADEADGGIEAKAYAITDDGQLAEASSLDEAAQLSADAAPAAAGRSAFSGGARAASKFVIALDPGHGGGDPGASRFGLDESAVTWKIAQYCKEALGTYANVEVVLTRGQNENPGLSERVRRAVAAKANVFVSLHINSATAESAHGAEVWIPNNSSYNNYVHGESSSLGNKILEKLSALGLSNRGVKVRDSERVDGEGPFYYPDGSMMDYYTVIATSRENGIPGIIVEHAFISNKSENEKLKQDSFLRQLGYADAEGIAEAYGLSSAWEKVDGHWKLKLADGTYATNCWQQIGGKWYWFDAQSFAVTGWQTIDGVKYYFDGSCAMQANGWFKQGNDWYWFTGSGAIGTGWLNTGGSWYWLDPSTGKMATGWMKASDGTWYYFNGSGVMQANGWHKLGGAWYWLTGSGARAAGWLNTGGSWYWLDPATGKMATGWVKMNDGTWYYMNGSGAMQSGGWHKLGASWYWLSGSGAMKTGWLSTGGSWYYLDRDSGAMRTGWYLDGKTWYYSNGSGAMQSGGWHNIGGAWYYLNGSGSMRTGWLSAGGSWYWLDPASGRMATGWAKASDSKWYYFDGSGAMRSGGWLKLGSNWYYLSGSGAMQTGWLSVGGERYYLNESGAMVTGTVVIGGETYRFGGSGALLSDTSIMGPSLATANQMAAYYNAQGFTYPAGKYQDKGAPTIRDFCQLVLEEANAEGVRAEVVFCQAMKETGWLQFGGSVDKNGKVQCNFAGIGATSATEGGATFPDVRTGLRAQVQHLKAYASTAPLVNQQVDPRFHLVTRGIAPNLEDLNGRWAVPGNGYGESINTMIKKLLTY